MPFYALLYHIGVRKGMEGHWEGNGHKLEESQTCQGIVCLRHLHQQGSLWPIWNPESGRWENSVTLVTLGHVSALCCIYWRQIIQPHYSNHSQPLPSRSVNKQQADSREPGGKQIQDTGVLFFISSDRSSCSRPLTTFSHNLLTLLKNLEHLCLYI